MAKKVVATLKKEGSSVMMTKAVRLVRSPKSGAYVFEERIMPKDNVKDFLK
ncbi:DUF4295 domain-containing protein [bacterium]|nr:DUF4295 domain-containing protein [bacterium]